MYQYTNGNHFRFGFNGEPWREWQDVDDKFFVQYGRPLTFEVMSWRKANEFAARRIARANKNPLAVCLSGGLDSQIVAQSFVDAGVEFSLFHYSTGHPFETQVATDFAKKIDRKLTIIDVDVREFFKGLNKQYEQVPIIHGTYELHAHLMDIVCSMGLVPIFGEGSLTRRIGQTWGVGEGHTYKTTSRHALKMGYQCIPVFFCYTPEQMHAYVRSNFIRQLTAGEAYNFTIRDGEMTQLSTRFNGNTVHHMKYLLIKEQYPELTYVRKQVGHEHLMAEDWYEYHLGKGKLTTDWKEYLKKHYLRFDFFEPNKLGDYFEGNCTLDAARVPYQPSAFWNYPD